MLPDTVIKKTRTISYAVIRITFYIKRQELKQRLESLTFELLENSAKASIDLNKSNLDRVFSVIAALEALIRLGHSIYEIEPINATILIEELTGLDSAIRQLSENNKEADRLPDLRKIFSESDKEDLLIENKPRLKLNKKDDFKKEGRDIDLQAKDSKVGRILEESLEKIAKKEDNDSAIDIGIRQSAIVNKIELIGNCRLKDVIADFPDVSERTLRYDLQRLCDRGSIERIGGGGPGTYYVLKNKAVSVTM